MITVEVKAKAVINTKWPEEEAREDVATFERRFRKEETFRKAIEELQNGKPIRFCGVSYTPNLETLKVTR